MNKRISFWQKKIKSKSGKWTKSPKYHGHYMLDDAGERTFVLSRIRKNGTFHNVTAKNPESAKDANWIRVK